MKVAMMLIVSVVLLNLSNVLSHSLSTAKPAVAASEKDHHYRDEIIRRAIATNNEAKKTTNESDGIFIEPTYTRIFSEENPISHRNPFYDNGGCLRNLAQRRNFTAKMRVCNSNDKPDAALLGYCHESPVLDYAEIRIAGQDWESNYMSAWLMQIVLSELLEVPTTVCAMM